MKVKKQPKWKYRPIDYRQWDAHPNINAVGWTLKIVMGLSAYLRGPAKKQDFDRDILPIIRDLTLHYVDNISTLLDANFGKGEKKKWQRYAKEVMGEA